MRVFSKRVVIGAVVVATALAIYALFPHGMPNAARYFEAPGSRVLQSDETGQIIHVRKMYDRMANTGDDFTGWNSEMQDFWKYTLAFSSYGLPSAMMIDPENKDEYRLLFDTMIWKMKSRRVWGDFTDRGFGPDPISSQNIMYKGHLNLMYGLYQLTTGDTRYAREYTWLTDKIAKELRLHHEGKYEGVTCEPNAWYVECNAIGIMSLHIYDKIYGTSYTENEVQWTLDFIMSRMRDPETGLFYRSYHPNQDVVLKDVSGYANAWTLAFLNPFLPDDMRRAYETGFKENLVINYGPLYAAIQGDARSDPGRNQVAHLFGLWAAKEFDDLGLYGKLRNSVDKMGKLGPAPEGGLTYKDDNHVLMNGVVLGSKLHVGWDEILSHDWGHTLPEKVPDIEGLSWRDILPSQIYQMNNGDNALPASSLDKRPCPNCYWGDYESIEMRGARLKVESVCNDEKAANPSCGLTKLDDYKFR